MHEFLVFTISGITTAGIYAITASGLTLTYVTTGVFNFAHGATGAFGAFLYWQLHVQWNWPTVPAMSCSFKALEPERKAPNIEACSIAVRSSRGR